MLSKSISVVLPAYNEEGNIYDVVNSVSAVLHCLTDDFEIIVVNDGSVDKTHKILEDLRSCDNRIKIVVHYKNQGYGAALISGFQNAGKEIILMMDADRQFNISDITKLIPYIEDFDIVTGFRIIRKDNSFRYLLGYSFNFLTKIIFGLSSRDINCGFKLFKASLIHNMRLTAKGALINVEIMALANKRKVKIKEIGISHYPRVYGKQTGGDIKVIIKAMLSIFQLMWRLRRE